MDHLYKEQNPVVYAGSTTWPQATTVPSTQPSIIPTTMNPIYPVIENKRDFAISYDLSSFIHDDGDKYIETTDANNILIKNYDRIVFDENTRTIWHKGIPYGNAYQFMQRGLSNPEYRDNAVFGNVLSHSISNSANSLVLGHHNKISGISNALALGAYNLPFSGSSYYIFSIGNGTSDADRKNAMSVNQNGAVIINDELNVVGRGIFGVPKDGSKNEDNAVNIHFPAYLNGDTNVTGKLNVTGNSIFGIPKGDDTNYDNAVNIHFPAYINGPLNVKGKMTVGGDAEFSGKLNVTGNLTASYVTANISYSYVSSLGTTATADVILSSLLTAAVYYAPSSSITVSGSSAHYEIGAAIPGSISVKASASKFAKYSDKYVKDYMASTSYTVSQKKSLMSSLAYSWKANSQTCGYNTGIKALYGIDTSAGKFNLEYVTVSPGADSNYNIYGNTHSIATNTVTFNPVESAQTVFNKIGKYTLFSNGTLAYSTPQPTYFEQLADKNVWVESTGKAWLTDASVGTGIGGTNNIHIGAYLYIGFFKNNDSNCDTLKNIFKDSTKSISKTIDANPSIGSVYFKKWLITCGDYQGKIGTVELTNSVLGSVIGGNSDKVKGVFVAYPEEYMVADASGGDNNCNSYIIQKTSISNPWANIANNAQFSVTVTNEVGNKTLKYRILAGFNEAGFVISGDSKLKYKIAANGNFSTQLSDNNV